MMSLLEHPLFSFMAESLKIEGIRRPPTAEELAATQDFLALDFLDVGAIERLVDVYAPGHSLRRRPGVNVRVGGYVAPAGGPGIEEELDHLIARIRGGKLTARAAHVEYERLHPFTDGNGRSGRAVWAWQMQDFPLGFLHTYYYQTLAESRS